MLKGSPVFLPLKRIRQRMLPIFSVTPLFCNDSGQFDHKGSGRAWLLFSTYSNPIPAINALSFETITSEEKMDVLKWYPKELTFISQWGRCIIPRPGPGSHFQKGGDHGNRCIPSCRWISMIHFNGPDDRDCPAPIGTCIECRDGSEAAHPGIRFLQKQIRIRPVQKYCHAQSPVHQSKRSRPDPRPRYQSYGYWQ